MKKNIVRICGIVLGLALSAASCAQGDITGGAETYYVVYDANGGIGTMEESAFTIGMPGKLRTNTFTRVGFTFGGWAETASGDVVYEDEGAITNLGTGGGTVILYAKWWGIEEFVWVASGTFTMGSPDGEKDKRSDETQHEVTLTKGFYIGKYPVTRKEWKEVMGNDPSPFLGEDDMPVGNITWHDAVEYCNKRSEKEGLTPAYTINGTNVTLNNDVNGYRLPTEAEWEYAARGGAKWNSPYYLYAGSNDLEKVAWTADGAHPVGTKAPNALGLYDMSGNGYEWCGDWFGDYPTSTQNPVGASTGSDRVFRGGGWGDKAFDGRSASRRYAPPSTTGFDMGFRLVRSQFLN